MLRDFGWNRYKHNVFTNPQYLNPDADVNGESEVFSTKSIAKEYDAIVIGSGISGLSSAAILSKAGKRVLVLEQHDAIGGAMHTFEQDGISFDAGVHYIGNMKENTYFANVINQVSDSVVEWNHNGDVTDQVLIGSSDNYQKFDLKGGSIDDFIQCVTSYFPDESSSIVKFVRLIQGIGKWGAPLLFISKTMPFEMLPIINLIGKKWLRYTNIPLKAVLDNLTKNTALKIILSYLWGDYNTRPSESSSFIHGVVLEHYLKNGTYYPVGGCEPMIKSLIKVIQKSNGMVYSKASVKRILVSKNKVTGVMMDRNDFVIKAPLVVSSAGVYNTLINLLPKNIVQKYNFEKKVNAVEASNAGHLICLTFNGSYEELGFSQSNYWIYSTADANNIQAYDFDKEYDDYMSSNGVIDTEKGHDIPYLYITCQSAKDPSLAQRYPNKTLVSALFPVGKDWYSEWKDTAHNRRSNEYKEKKNALLDRAVELVSEYFPKCADKLSTASIGTSLTFSHFLRNRDGGFYGSFSPLYNKPDMSWVRGDTPIEGLYMTGQDLVMNGWMPSLSSSLITCSRILHRIMYVDVYIAQLRSKKIQ
jgi:all-trans-retinol 13,14-reductase